MYEIYLVARGESTAGVDGEVVSLQAGDLLAVEPGEAHTFVASSEGYLHFVVQAPIVAGDKRSPMPAFGDSGSRALGVGRYAPRHLAPSIRACRDRVAAGTRT